MAINVRIPTPLRKLTGDQEVVTAEGSNLSTIIENLESTYPGLKERLLDEQGAVRRFINIYLNDEDIRFLQNLETPVEAKDEISIVPAIAGG